MTVDGERTVVVTSDILAATITEVSTPEFLAWFDALTDDDIATQIARNPDAAPELDDAWFARARLVRPLKAAE